MLALRLLESPDQSDDNGRLQPERLGHKTATAFAVRLHGGQPVVNHVHLAARALGTERLEDGGAHTDDGAAPTSDHSRTTPVQREVVLYPDDGRSRSARREHGDEGRFDPVGVNDGRAVALEQSP